MDRCFPAAHNDGRTGRENPGSGHLREILPADVLARPARHDARDRGRFDPQVVAQFVLARPARPDARYPDAQARRWRRSALR